MKNWRLLAFLKVNDDTSTVGDTKKFPFCNCSMAVIVVWLYYRDTEERSTLALRQKYESQTVCSLLH